MCVCSTSPISRPTGGADVTPTTAVSRSSPLPASFLLTLDIGISWLIWEAMRGRYEHRCVQFKLPHDKPGHVGIRLSTCHPACTHRPSEHLRTFRVGTQYSGARFTRVIIHELRDILIIVCRQPAYIASYNED